ncbi:MAG: hypothetical protein HYU67_12550 [Flavobacteriia bacterium]|nr:hypothetical protein [Flavobacteriia bacterium]
MKKIYFFVFVLISTLTIVYFKTIERLLIENNFSWTISKALPYFLVVVLGFILSYFIYNLAKTKIIKLILSVFVAVLPFIISFIFHPIYEGDFSRVGTSYQLKNDNQDFQTVDLVVLTIPGCPFCHESTIYSNKMLLRQPRLKIKYIVCDTNTREIEPYQKKLNRKISVSLAKDLKLCINISQGSFPTFVALKNKKIVEKWSNDQFGVRAKDFVENFIR